MDADRPDLDDDYVPPLKGGRCHPDVARECVEAAGRGLSWTELRPLREGVDDPSGRSCEGWQGRPCAAPVVGVQHNSAFGDALFFCEEHGIMQDEWDRIHAPTVRESPPL